MRATFIFGIFCIGEATRLNVCSLLAFKPTHLWNLRFGINCYGEKPVASDSDKDRLALSEPTIPDTPEDSELANKIKEWKENPDKYLRVNSFNYNKWSKHE